MTGRSRQPPAAECELCAALATFLRDQARRSYDWPFAEPADGMSTTASTRPNCRSATRPAAKDDRTHWCWPRPTRSSPANASSVNATPLIWPGSTPTTHAEEPDDSPHSVCGPAPKPVLIDVEGPRWTSIDVRG